MRFKLLSLALISVLLTACLGGINPPDETRVIAGPDLSLPPEFRLPKPSNSAPATPAERTAAETVAAAEAALLGASDDMEMTQDPSSESSIDFVLNGE